MSVARYSKGHFGLRSNWLRAAVLGANDGIVSTASLVLGVAASGASSRGIVTAGIAGLVAGALSMATGEFVSVSSQRDLESADLHLEARELREDPAGELDELTGLYERRGVPADLARQVAHALSEHDALDAHAREELGLGQERRPLEAAWASAVAFSLGSAPPVLAVALIPAGQRELVCVSVTVVALAVLGALGARLGGADPLRASVRVVGWGAVAMAVTAGIGTLVGRVG